MYNDYRQTAASQNSSSIQGSGATFQVFSRDLILSRTCDVYSLAAPLFKSTGSSECLFFLGGRGVIIAEGIRAKKSKMKASCRIGAQICVAKSSGSLESLLNCRKAVVTPV